MEINAILSRFKQQKSGAILEKSRFGRGGAVALWIDSRDMAGIARALAADPDLRIDWLENLSVAQLGESLVATYVLRSRETPALLMLRSTIEAPRLGAEPAELVSVRACWPMAAAMEDEAAELFGLRFIDEKGQPIPIEPRLLGPGSPPYPMRKAPHGSR